MSKQILSWHNETRRLSDLVPWERNPRQIKDAEAKRLGKSLLQFGQVQTVAIGPDNQIYDGHQRALVWSLLQEGGDREVDVRVSSRPLTEKEREKLVVYLHRGTVGEWDFSALANGFDFDELIEWGFSESELVGFDFGHEEPVGEDPGADLDKAAELQAKWNVQSGQLWVMGDHRLICGDCTDPAVVARVMGGNLCSLVITDPPYGVDYASKNRFLNAIWFANRIEEPIVGDDGDKASIQKLWECAFRQMNQAMEPGAVVYCFMPQGGDQMMMMMMMMDAGIEPRHELIWLKNNHVLGRTDYAYKHEPILYAWKEGGHKFYGDFQTSILECNRPQKSDLHPTTKPVELIERFIENSSLKGGIVYDPFLGSGTTLIACEKLNRRCRAIEVEPKYCAVALERWSVMSGQTPVLEKA